MFLPSETFKTVLESTPLVAIDLIVQNSDSQVLLGKRVNRPAKGFWFTPGGRILKNETLEQAFVRLTRNELNISIDYNLTEFLGVYEHLYTDSIFGEDISTHYVVLAYRLVLSTPYNLPLDQHSDYLWFNINDIYQHPLVHANVKRYFL